MKLVDMLGLGSDELKFVGVQIPLSAIKKAKAKKGQPFSKVLK